MVKILCLDYYAAHNMWKHKNLDICIKVTYSQAESRISSSNTADKAMQCDADLLVYAPKHLITKKQAKLVRCNANCDISHR